MRIEEPTIKGLSLIKDLGSRNVTKSAAGKPSIKKVFLVRCNACGKEYEIRASSYREGRDSCGCVIKNRETAESLQDKLNIKYPNHKLDFSNFEMKIGQHTELSIICKTHGEFKTTANKMLNNSKDPCPSCNSELTNKNRNADIEGFIAKALLKYGDKFGYDKVSFNILADDVEILCNTHNEYFKINANNFLYSAKVCCPLCIKEGRDLTKLNKTPDFINECEKIHKGKYDLSKVEYKGWVQPIEVICQEHGVWFPSAGNFQRGSGCPFCMKTENRYTSNPTKLYYIKYKGVYKLGITTRDIYSRYKSKDIPASDIHNLEILYEQLFDGGHIPYKIEQKIRSIYNKYVYQGENIFKVTGNTEIFTEDVLGLDVYNKERLDYFNKLIEEGLDETL